MRLARAQAVADASIRALAGDVTALVTSAEDSNADDEHDPEGATIAFERAQLLSRLDEAKKLSASIKLALTKLDAGTLGTCDHCGGTIAEDRLVALPWTTRCFSCASSIRLPTQQRMRSAR